jgi:hypothetical protein
MGRWTLEGGWHGQRTGRGKKIVFFAAADMNMTIFIPGPISVKGRGLDA